MYSCKSLNFKSINYVVFFVGKMVDMVICNWSHFIKMFSNSILHNIVGTDLTKAKYFRDMYLLITASSEDLPSCSG